MRPIDVLRMRNAAVADPAPTAWGLYLDPWDDGASSNLYTAVAELQMFASTDGSGTNLCTGGTASASASYPTHLPADAFAGDGTTSFWSAGTSGQPQWLKYTLPAGQEVRSITLTAPADQSTWGNVPNGLRFGYWSGATFVPLLAYSQLSGWTNSQVQTFTVPARNALPSKTARYHRLVSLRNFDPYNAHILTGLEFRASPGGAKLTGTLSVSSTVAGGATELNDGNGATYWQGAGTGAGPRAETITLDMGSGNSAECVEVALSPLAGNLQYTPSDFYVLYSHDGATWYYNWHVFAISQGGYTGGTFRVFTR